MLDLIETILREDCGLERDKPLLVGVSGGPDSLCLLSALRAGGWTVVAAHFNHLLRAEADEDAAAVEAMAAGMGIEFVGGRGEVRTHAARQKASIETAARELRYRFLFAQAHRCQAQAVAVGHTADDQVETVLMHVIRGSGLNGLSGMPYRSILPEYDTQMPLVRPLLDTWRSETVTYCELHGLKPLHDASNESMEYLRNRIRHELMPMLETYNPRFREAVLRTSKTLSADHELLSNAIEPFWQECLERQSEAYVALKAEALYAQPVAMQMQVLRRAIQTLLPGTDSGYEDVRRAAAFVADPTQERADFAGGLLLLREGATLYITATLSALPTDQWPQMPAGMDSARFSPPFNASLAGGWIFSCTASDAARIPDGDDANPYEGLVDATGLHEGLELRVRRPGDRFEPLGMQGHTQKLSDFFINAKLPARARERWPLVCAGDQVVWVPGYRPAHWARLSPASKNVLKLAVIPPAA